MISGPMPSPGRTAIFMSEVPGVLGFSLRLERADLVRVAQREPDVVQPVQQALALEGVEVERDLAAGRIDDQLPLEVDLGRRDFSVNSMAVRVPSREFAW